jgi:hypothetical protein
VDDPFKPGLGLAQPGGAWHLQAPAAVALPGRLTDLISELRGMIVSQLLHKPCRLGPSCSLLTQNSLPGVTQPLALP